MGKLGGLGTTHVSNKARIPPLLILAALVVALPGPARAETSGLVVSVRDGDTLTVLGPNKQRHKIKLAGIDAPEKGQASGYRSKESLANMVYDRDVLIEGTQKDRHGRLVAKVFVDGHDIGLEQVRTGLAWWCRACAGELTPEDRVVYELAEKTAREQKLRLWRDPKPVPPWDWREQKR